MDTHVCDTEPDQPFHLPDEISLEVAWTAMPGKTLPVLPLSIPLKRQRLRLPVGKRKPSSVNTRPLPLFGLSSEDFDAGDGIKIRFIYAFSGSAFSGSAKLFVVVESTAGSRVFSCPAVNKSFCFMKKPATSTPFVIFTPLAGPAVTVLTSDSYASIASTLVSGGYASYAEAHSIETIGATGWEIGQIHCEDTQNGIPLRTNPPSVYSFPGITPYRGGSVFPVSYVINGYIGIYIPSYAPASLPKWDVAGHITMSYFHGCQQGTISSSGRDVIYSGDSDYELSFEDTYDNFSIFDHDQIQAQIQKTVAAGDNENLSAIPFIPSRTHPDFRRVIGSAGTQTTVGLDDEGFPDLPFDVATFIGRLSPSLKYRPQTEADRPYPSSGTIGRCCDCTSLVRSENSTHVLENGIVLSGLPALDITNLCQSAQQTGNVQSLVTDSYDENGDPIDSTPAEALSRSSPSHAWLKVTGKPETQQTVALPSTNAASGRKDFLLIESVDAIDCNSVAVNPAVMIPFGGMDTHAVSGSVQVLRQGSVSQNEIVKITIKGPPASGTYLVRFMGVNSDPIPFNADAATLKAALEAMSTIDIVDVVPLIGPSICFSVEFQGTLSNTNVSAVSLNTTGLAPQSPEHTGQRISLSSDMQTIQAASATQNKIVKFTIPDPLATGTFQITFGGNVTAPILFSASALDIETEVESLPGINDVAVVLVSGTTATFSIEFMGTLANTDAPLMSVSFGQVSFNTSNCQSDYRNCPGSLMEFTVTGLSFDPLAMQRDVKCQFLSGDAALVVPSQFAKNVPISLLVPAATGFLQFNHIPIPSLNGIFIEGSYEDCCGHTVVPEHDIAVDSGTYGGVKSRSCALFGHKLLEAWWRGVNTGATDDYAVADPYAGQCGLSRYGTAPYGPPDGLCGIPFSEGGNSWGDHGIFCGFLVGLPQDQCLWVSRWPMDVTARLFADNQNVVTSLSPSAGVNIYVSPYDQWKKVPTGQTTGFLQLLPGSFGKGPARDADYSYINGPVTIKAEFFPAIRKTKVTMSYNVTTQLRRPYDTFTPIYTAIFGNTTGPSPVYPAIGAFYVIDSVFGGAHSYLTIIFQGFFKTGRNYEVGIVSEKCSLIFETNGIDADECLRPNTNRSRVLICPLVSETVVRGIDKPFTIVTNPIPPFGIASSFNVLPAPFPDLATYSIPKFIQASGSANIDLKMIQRGVEPVNYPPIYQFSLGDDMGDWTGDHDLKPDSFENHWLKEVATFPFTSIMLVPGWYLVFFEDRDGVKSVAAKYRLSCRDRVRAQWNRYGTNDLELASCNQNSPWPRIITISSLPLVSP